jgi:pantetheine-phosphate adenylyltransferase
MVSAVFPGTFDPPTYGHLNIIERAKGIFEKIYVVIAVNKSKKTLFSVDERVSLMTELVKDYPNVCVASTDSLVVKFAKENGARVLIRGVRSVPDFSYEFDLSILNKALDPGIETIFIPTDPKYFVLRSSAIKEMAAFKGDLSNMVPPLVEKAVRRKMET